MKEVLVCGGREFNDWTLLHDSLRKLTIDTIVNGAARGADRMSSKYAEQYGINQILFPANWTKYNKAGGYHRNIMMIERTKPDVVIAFPGGKGTEMMIDIAKMGGYKVWQPALDANEY